MNYCRLIRLTGFICVLSVLTACSNQQPATQSEPDHTVWTLQSDILDETRAFRTSLPEDYSEQTDYPVIIVTDAGANFDLVRAYIDFSTDRWARLPDMIIVGIDNVDRNRDFIPRPDPNFPGTGRSETFLDFVEMELLPEIDDRYATDGTRILVGHSFGGTNAIQFALERPNVFNAHIAIGSSTWVANRALFEIAEAEFANPPNTPTWLYMSVAERDGGRTVPDGEAFASYLEAHAPETLSWHFEIIPETTHFNAVVPSLHNAFERLFPVWYQRDSIRETLISGDPDSVDQWFAAQAEAYGFRFIPQAWDLLMEAYRLSAQGEGDLALRLLQRLAAAFPDNHSLLLAQGDVLQQAGQIDAAKHAYNAAREMALQEGAHPNEVATVDRRINALEAANDEG